LCGKKYEIIKTHLHRITGPTSNAPGNKFVIQFKSTIIIVRSTITIVRNLKGKNRVHKGSIYFWME